MAQSDRIDRLLASITSKEERTEILEAYDQIASAFDALLSYTKQVLFSEPTLVFPAMDKATAAFRCLHAYGERYGIVFPEPSGDRETAICVVDLCRESLR